MFSQEHTHVIFATQAAAEFNKSLCDATESIINGEHHPLFSMKINIFCENVMILIVLYCADY